MSRSLTLKNLYKSLNIIFKNQFIILMITISCVDNSRNNASRINTFFTDLDIEKMAVFTPENATKTEEEKRTIFIDELKLLGATDHQIKFALGVFNSLECVKKDTCISLVREALLKTARYQDFTRRLILEVQPDKHIQIFRDHIPIPQDLKEIHAKTFNNHNNLELIQYRSDLYLKFIHRGLKEDGTLNRNFPVPEMAVAFEKIEEEFLLLREAFSVNPAGIKNFIRRFGVTEVKDIEIIFNQFKDNIDFTDNHYKIILAKIKDEGWAGLKYYSLMHFYCNVYSLLNFSTLDPNFRYGQDSWLECTDTEKKDLLRLISTRGFYESKQDLASLIKGGHIGLISNHELPELDIFLTHAAVPLFNLIAPDYFMMSYDLLTRYGNEFNAHDFFHADQVNKDRITQIFRKGGTREEMLKSIGEEIQRRLENAIHIESFKQRFTEEDRKKIDTVLYDHFRENNVSNFLEDLKALGVILKKFLDDPENSRKIIEKYKLLPEEVMQLQSKLREFIKNNPYIFEENLQEISHFFAEYSK
jgi:hypothetical protein